MLTFIIIGVKIMYKVSDYITKGHSKSLVVAYPQNSISVIAKIMKEIHLSTIPVFESPWNKKLIGIIKYDMIKSLAIE